MKKILLAAAAVFSVATAYSAEPVFNVGDRQGTLTIGVGSLYVKGGDPKSPATFDQHLSMEWGVAKFSDKFTLGIGFQVNNSYGGKQETMLAGEYNYTVSEHFQAWKWQNNSWKVDKNETVKHRRKGVGTCTADLNREDVGAEFIASLHFSPMKKLDTYFTLGAGAAYQHYMTSNRGNYKGFGKGTVKASSTEIPKVVKTKSSGYSYDDAAHAEFTGIKDKVAPTISAYIGATYHLNDKWGIGVQIGIINTNLRVSDKAYAPQYGIFAVGATCKF